MRNPHKGWKAKAHSLSRHIKINKGGKEIKIQRVAMLQRESMCQRTT